MPKRKICFVAAENEEIEYYAQRFFRHDPDFCDSLAEVPGSVEVLSVFIGESLGGDFLRGLKKLRLIATRSSGCDHIDLAACQDRRVTVSGVAGYGENTVAEHTFALMLALSRRLRESREAALYGHFTHEQLRGFDLRGSTLGVIGTGRVGMHVIRIAAAFGMTVVAHDIRPNPLYTELVDFRYVPFEDVLARSDILTLHIPFTAETRHLLRRETLSQCKRGVHIINTARGGLIDSSALIEALENGQVGGAGLDVLEEESVFRGGATALLGAQIADRVRSCRTESDRISATSERMSQIARTLASNALLRSPRVVFTPHNAYNSEEARHFINRFTSENIEAYLDGRPPRHVLFQPEVASARSRVKKRA